jgi:hypothetical protein
LGFEKDDAGLLEIVEGLKMKGEVVKGRVEEDDRDA